MADNNPQPKNETNLPELLCRAASGLGAILRADTIMADRAAGARLDGDAAVDLLLAALAGLDSTAMDGGVMIPRQCATILDFCRRADPGQGSAPLDSEQYLTAMLRKALANVDRFGLQDEGALYLACVEELGEIAEAILKCQSPARVADELHDLAALQIQRMAYWMLPAGAAIPAPAVGVVRTETELYEPEAAPDSAAGSPAAGPLPRPGRVEVEVTRAEAAALLSAAEGALARIDETGRMQPDADIVQMKEEEVLALRKATRKLRAQRGAGA